MIIEINGVKHEIEDSLYKHIYGDIETKIKSNPKLFGEVSNTVVKNIVEKLSPEIKALLADKITPETKGKDLGELFNNVLLTAIQSSKPDPDDKNKNKKDPESIDEIILKLKEDNAKELLKIKEDGESQRKKDKIDTFKGTVTAHAITNKVRTEHEGHVPKFIDDHFKFDFDKNEKIIISKIDGEPFLNKKGERGNAEDIANFIKEAYPGIHASSVPGANLGPGADGKPAQKKGLSKEDLGKDSSTLIKEGLKEIEKPDPIHVEV